MVCVVPARARLHEHVARGASQAVGGYQAAQSCWMPNGAPRVASARRQGRRCGACCGGPRGGCPPSRALRSAAQLAPRRLRWPSVWRQCPWRRLCLRVSCRQRPPDVWPARAQPSLGHPVEPCPGRRPTPQRAQDCCQRSRHPVSPCPLRGHHVVTTEPRREGWTPWSRPRTRRRQGSMPACRLRPRCRRCPRSPHPTRRRRTESPSSSSWPARTGAAVCRVSPM